MASSAHDRPPSRGRPIHWPIREKFNRSNIIFVTVCAKNRLPRLNNSAAQMALISAWKEASHYLVGRYVIMPDHVHLFCSPATEPVESLVKWVRMWKSLAASRWPEENHRKLWQRDFWDRQLRQGSSYSAKWDYVWRNPVRAGLVTKPEEWPCQGELNVLNWQG